MESSGNFTEPAKVSPDSQRQDLLLAATIGGVVLVTALSAPQLSASLILTWPWAVPAACWWILLPTIAVWNLMRHPARTRLGLSPDTGFALLALATLCSFAFSPVRGALWSHLLPTIGALSAPYAMRALLTSERREHVGATIGIGLVFTILSGLWLWITSAPPDAMPWDIRNASPFGHANMTGSFGVFAAAWFGHETVRLREHRAGFLLNAAGLALALALAAGSQSRGAMLALAAGAGGVAAITLLRTRRFATLTLALAAILLGVAAVNPQLRHVLRHGEWQQTVRESNDQRTAMLVGGWRLGLERPEIGWGVGSVPHVFPMQRGPLPGTADNVLQLHNTPAQVWATLGATATLLIAIGVVIAALRGCWTPERTVLAGGILACGTQLLFDHPFALPALPALGGLLLAAWSPTAPAGRARMAWLPALALLAGAVAALPFAIRDLMARRAYDHALASAEINSPMEYRDALRQAMRLAPGDPYYPMHLAGQLATGYPFPEDSDLSMANAIVLLRRIADRYPAQEYAHLNLGWSLLNQNPPEAEAHFRQAARLAPARTGVHLGIALAALREGDQDEAVRELAAECLLDPAFAWSPIWSTPDLSPLRDRVMQRLLALTLPDSPETDALRNAWAGRVAVSAKVSQTYRRVRGGAGVLYGHPDGPAPTDIDAQMRVEIEGDLAGHLPPRGWLSGKRLLEILGSP